MINLQEILIKSNYLMNIQLMLNKMHKPDSQLGRRSPLSNMRSQGRSKSPLSKSPSNRSFMSSSPSATSQHLWGTLGEAEVFPDFCLELLKNEDKYIRKFKKTIQGEKAKVNNEMSSYVSEINHTIEDFRLSLLASIDQIYRRFLEKYSQFRADLVEINRIKEQITAQAYASINKNKQINRRKSNINNEHTIYSIETSHEEFRRYHIMKYISDLQKEKLLPVKEIGENLIILTQYDNGFIQAEELKKSLNNILEQFRFSSLDLLKRKYEFLRDPDALIMKEKQQHPRQQEEESEEEVQNYQPHEEKPPIDFTLYRKPQERQTEIPPHINVFRNYEIPSEPSMKSLREGNEEVFLSVSKVVGSVSPQIVLCCLPINENMIGVGSKDGSLIFYEQKGGKPVVNAQDHRSSVCTLSLVDDGNFLCSGSDHPHPQIIVWDTATLQPKAKFKEHKAAVTAIQCLRDGVHMVSGSYDKKICIYNYREKKLKYTLPSNKSSVTGMVINNDGTKMASCSLDNTINIWQIVKRDNVVETMFLEQIVENGSMICSMVGSPLQNNLIYIGTKDGKIKLINIEKGQSIKTIACSNNAIIELVIVGGNILAWPCKQQSIKIVNTNSGKTSVTPTKGYLEFSCGVGPKAILTQNKQLCVVSQSESKQITFYTLK